jgi:hypothetical protein
VSYAKPTWPGHAMRFNLSSRLSSHSLKVKLFAVFQLKIEKLFCSTIGVVATLGTFALGQTAPDTKPSAPPATARATSIPSIPTISIRATIKRITGTVQIRHSENEQWQPAREGMEVDVGVEFRTGLRSSVVFFMPPDQQITLDSFTNMTILRAFNDGRRVTTDLGMKYGRTKYGVEEAGVEHEATIRSPGSTLAVRGTRNMSLSDHAGFAPVATASQPVRFKNTAGLVVAFGQPGVQTTMAGDQSSPATGALTAATVDPAGQFVGRTAGENQIISYISRVDPNFNLNQFPVLKILTNPDMPDTSGGGTLPISGQLRFLLVWNGTPKSNVDLSVTSPDRRTVSVLNPTSPNSGHHLGDGIANADGFGQETLIYERMYLAGTYTIKTDMKTSGAVNAQVFVVRDPLTTGKLIGQFSFKLTTARPGTTRTITTSASTPSSGTLSARRSAR